MIAVVILIIFIKGKRQYILQCQIIPVLNVSVSNIASGKIDVHFRLNRDAEQQVMKSLFPYGISEDYNLHMKRELLLWFSSYTICAPWILAQCEITPMV